MGKNTGSLGRSLVKSRFTKNLLKTGESDKWLHTMDVEDTSDWSKTKGEKSVTEQSALDEFLTTAEMAGKEFESERLNIKFVNPKASIGLLSKEEIVRIKEVQTKNSDLLRIPRRPVWKGSSLDGKELQAKEREAFLEWRRDLSKAQENEALKMTPFEKNLEFWRQLWRVIERSDVVVQIVDARNPLLFYCQDLEKYVKEVDGNKVNIVLVNKSDFLTAKQRLEWLRYFEKHSIRVAFWSAVLSHQLNDLANLKEHDDDQDDQDEEDEEDDDETTKSHEHNEEEEEDEEEEDDDDEDDDEGDKLANKFGLLGDEKSGSDEEDVDQDNHSDDQDEEEEDEEEDEEENDVEEEEKEKQINAEPNPVTPKTTEKNNIMNEAKETTKKEDEEEELSKLEISTEEREKITILTREELIDLFKRVHAHIMDKSKPGCTTVGLVGYPNVGKSSTINAIMKNKRVAVSDTPGKTKHYQTMYIDENQELLLCDCPGLVFPSFVSTKGELILNGVLSIDQMRDYVEPINLLIHHIPREVFEVFYGVELPKPKEGQDPNRLPFAEELCSAYARYRGYMNHKGMPDVQRGARIILKDYMNGKLLYCYPPPGFDSQSFQEHRYETSKEIKYMEKVAKMQQKLLNSKNEAAQVTSSTFDREFFADIQSKARTKGGIVGYHRRNQAITAGSEVNRSGDNKKEWKKHQSGKKREKLRIINRHLDEHPDY